jgi:hypothetical protein
MLKTEEGKKIASSIPHEERAQTRKTGSNSTVSRTGGNNMFKRF